MGRMKKARWVIFAINLCLLLTIAVKILYKPEKKYLLSKNDETVFVLTERGNGYSRNIKPWYDEKSDTYYFFVSGRIGKKEIWTDKYPLCGIDIVNNDEGKIILDECNKPVIINSDGSDYNVVFKITSSIPSLFIDTKTGSMNNINEDKNNKESGTILSLSESSEIQYNGEFSSMKGHGNDTWLMKKKPYSINFEKDTSLAGLEASKEWILLAMFFEGDKIHSKVAYDFAQLLGAPNYIESTWVDVYINGEYSGLYLLAQSAKSKFGNEDEYLLEKEIAERCSDVSESFSTPDNNSFVLIKNKKNNNVSDAYEWVQGKENLIKSSQISSAIDIDSFAIQYLVDEISMNFDSFKTSAYYIKKKDEDIIYAGPAWDYDGAFGEFLHQGPQWTNYNLDVLDMGWEQLTWWDKINKNQYFVDAVRDKLNGNKDSVKKLFTTQIDEYSKLIKQSVEADLILYSWNDEDPFRPGIYQTWDNDVRYLKYFLVNRFNVISDWYNIDIDITWENNGTYHQVCFYDDKENVICELSVLDGESINVETIQKLKEYSDGSWRFSYSGEQYCKYIPILEDCEINYCAP